MKTPALKINKAPLKVGSLVRLTGNGALVHKVTALQGERLTLQNYGYLVRGVCTLRKRKRTCDLEYTPGENAVRSKPGYYWWEHVTMAPWVEVTA